LAENSAKDRKPNLKVESRKQKSQWIIATACHFVCPRPTQQKTKLESGKQKAEIPVDYRNCPSLCLSLAEPTKSKTERPKLKFEIGKRKGQG
jgi:hypothetical protein